MRLIEQLVRGNYGLIKDIYRNLNKKAAASENNDEIDIILLVKKQKKGEEIIFSDYTFGSTIRSLYKGKNISFENKKLITWAINKSLGTNFSFKIDEKNDSKTIIFDLEKEVGTEKITV